MEFTFQTEYDQKALTAMARALRKTARRKRSRRSHIFGWVVVLLAALLALPENGEAFSLGIREAVTFLAALAIVVALIFEDAINGYVARKRLLPGTEKSIVTFMEECYHSETEVGKSEFQYDKIQLLAETSNYFVFIFSASHAQLYDKRCLQGGSADEFRKFIEEKTGKTVESI